MTPEPNQLPTRVLNRLILFRRTTQLKFKPTRSCSWLRIRLRLLITQFTAQKKRIYFHWIPLTNPGDLDLAEVLAALEQEVGRSVLVQVFVVLLMAGAARQEKPGTMLVAPYCALVDDVP